MRYYKIFPLDGKPFLNIDLWANSLEELQTLGEGNNPLIIAEDVLPSKQFGVYTHKIESGALIAIDAIEMAQYEAEFLVMQTLASQNLVIKTLNSETFAFSGNYFPMDEAARIRYNAVAMLPAANTDFITNLGTIVTIALADIATFTNAYYSAIKNLTQIKSNL